MFKMKAGFFYFHPDTRRINGVNFLSKVVIFTDASHFSMRGDVYNEP
jgi:hypothetical protein